MNSWLDKKAYNDTRYGARNSLKELERVPQNKKDKKQKYRTQNDDGSFGDAGLVKLRASGMIAMALSMSYGIYDAITTGNEYTEVAHRSFQVAFIEITWLWTQIATPLGISANSFFTSVVEFVAVAAALPFALFAGIGGLFVHIFQMLFHS
jgi:hypothetical protein